MSEKKYSFPAGLASWLFAGLIGILVTAGCLAGMAALMVSQGISGSAAAPMATTAVGLGSFFSGWVAAFRMREHGLFCGLVEGALNAALLIVLALPAGILIENTMLLRFAVAVLCGCLGGFFGVGRRARAHI